METNLRTAQQQEIVQSIHTIDVKLQQAKSEQEYAQLEQQLATALEKMLRQVTQKND